MRTNETTGIWIDNSRAVVVRMNGDEAIVKHLDSEVESKHRSTGGIRAKVHYLQRTSVSQTRNREKRENDFRKFFKRVQSEAGQGDNYVILGPGQTKLNFKAYLMSSGQDETRFDRLETTHSRMTDPEIVAMIKERLGKPAPRFGKESAI